MTDPCNTNCTNLVGPDYAIDQNGIPIPPSISPSDCHTNPDGSVCPTIPDMTCRPFQLENQTNTECLTERLVSEHLNIGGATLNVYKLLGVHEQGKLVDQTGKGSAISNGDTPLFLKSYAFDVFTTEWRSIQRGDGVTASSYLGYDFGYIKTTDDTRNRYGIDTSIRKHITALAIKQSSNSKNRVTRVRVERSTDGSAWYGVSIVLLPDDDCLNTVLFKDSVLSRYWRIRPLDFNGETDDYWGVQALQLYHEYVGTNEDNIQDKIFVENRDRDYSVDALPVKGSYDLIDVTTELSKFGIEVPNQTLYISVSFSTCVAVLGRPIIVGDILEIPSEAQYSAEMERIEKWMEVTDVGWSTEGYTPSWKPTMLRIIVQPAYASQETQDIFGDLAEIPDALGLMDKGDGNHPVYQDISDLSQQAQELAKEHVPERGAEGSGTIREFTEAEILSAEEQGIDHITRIGLNSTGLYVEDAIPSNNEPYTEGTLFPATPTHGDYHRMTYVGLSKDVPARLYRYSTSKNRWIFLEKDKRAEYNDTKPTLQEFLTSSGKTPHTDITS